MTQIKNMPHSIGAYLKGVGVESVELDANNHLIVHLDNGETVDAGEFKVDDELDAESTRPLANKKIAQLNDLLGNDIDLIRATIGNISNSLYTAQREIDELEEGLLSKEQALKSLINSAANQLNELDEHVNERIDGTVIDIAAVNKRVDQTVTDITAVNTRVDEAVATIEANMAETEGGIALLNEYSEAERAKIREALADKVDKENGKGLSSNDYTDEEKNKLNSKQDALTLTVKDNGNIVIGNISGQTKEFMPATPSGDPMHYYYLSHCGVTYNAATGFFELEYLKDLTANDMRNAVRVSGDTRWLYNESSSVNGLTATEDAPRTNIAMKSGIIKVRDKYDTIRWERALEQWIIGKCSAYSFTTITDVWDGDSGLKVALVGLSKLRYIVGVIDISTLRNGVLPSLLGDSTTKLQEVRLAKMKTSQMIIHQKNLSKDSISYLLSNRTNTEEISLTLPAELYNKIMNVGGEWADLRTLCAASGDKGAVILEQNA